MYCDKATFTYVSIIYSSDAYYPVTCVLPETAGVRKTHISNCYYALCYRSRDVLICRPHAVCTVLLIFLILRLFWLNTLCVGHFWAIRVYYSFRTDAAEMILRIISLTMPHCNIKCYGISPLIHNHKSNESMVVVRLCIPKMRFHYGDITTDFKTCFANEGMCC